jgi:hypothetical protein
MAHQARREPIPLRCRCRRDRRDVLNRTDPISAASHLRLVWPQWQGAGTESIRSLAPEFPFDVARRGYSVGTKVLQAVLSQHAARPLSYRSTCAMRGSRSEERDGIEAKTAVLEQLRAALAIVQEHDPARITTLSGECSVSGKAVAHSSARCRTRAGSRALPTPWRWFGD